MLLPQATERLSKALTKYTNMIKQEKLIMTEAEISSKLHQCQELIGQVENQISTEPLSLLKTIEDILEDIHKTCTNTENVKEENIIPDPTTILIESATKKKFVLSKNIPRPQINFKNRDVYAMKPEGFYHSNSFIRTAQSAKTPAETVEVDSQTVEGCENIEDATRSILMKLYSSTKIIDVTTEISPNIYYIKTAEECKMANTHILQEAAVGVDIKTHKFRSYSGFTCYIQVATLESIYLFDMIELRNNSELLTFWSNSSVVKVFYKATEKVYWLKKDLQYTVKAYVDLLSIYGYPEEVTNLGRAVMYATGRKLRKQLQLMDWRYKPISVEMCTDLTEQVGYLLLSVAGMAKKCTEEQFVSGYNYKAKKIESDLSPEEFLLSKNIEPTEISVKLHMLRDFIAKQEDESPQFLMTDKQLVRFIKEQPTTQEQVFSLFKNISPLFKANLNNFINLLHSTHKTSSFNMTALKDKS
ncbi:exosome complex exonuclease RRP6 [Nematocida parisii]|nr:exosome complex exonuclease RRP6 [Nematocida parisii]